MQGALGGLVVLVLAAGSAYVFSWLWQQALLSEAAEAIGEAKTMGVEIQPLGFGPSIVAKGHHNGTSVVVAWRGGVRGTRTTFRIGRKTRVLPLITRRDEFHRLMLGEE